MDIDIRHVPVDKLTTWTETSLESRRIQIVNIRAEYEAKFVTASKELTEVTKIAKFLEQEQIYIELALELTKGNVVRVNCPECKGTGMRPANVLSGQVSKGTAFEATGKPHAAKPSVIDEKNCCRECKGQRWVIMDRFKG
jgi:hypothetical protein